MLRRNNSIWILLGAICFVVLAYLAYSYYLAPLYQSYSQQQQTIDFSTNRSLSFGKQPEQEGIFSIELEVEGQATGNFVLHIANEKEVMHQAAIKGKPLRFEYMGDWYTDSCHLFFDGPDKLQGNALVSIRFLSID